MHPVLRIKEVPVMTKYTQSLEQAFAKASFSRNLNEVLFAFQNISHTNAY